MADQVNSEPDNKVDQPVRGKSLGLDQLDDWDNEDLDIVRGGSNAKDGLKIPTRAEVEARKAEEANVDIEEDEDDDVVEPEAPEPVSIDDPGEYIPQDYSFDVVTYDEEGNKPKTHKITSVEEWDNLLEEEPSFGNAAALMKASRLATKMESNLERDLEKYESQKEEFDTAKQASDQKATVTNSMVSEVNYLIDKGELPKVSKKYRDADWSDKDVASQPGVKEQIELLTYMRDENARRVKAGLKAMHSVLDAFNAMSVDTNRTKLKEAEQETERARKAAGARVAGSTPAPVTNVPKGIAVGRVGNLNNLGGNWN